MTRLAAIVRTPALLAGMALLSTTSSVQAALSTSKGNSDQPGGMIWVFFAVIVLGTLGLAFMPSKRKDAE